MITGGHNSHLSKSRLKAGLILSIAFVLFISTIAPALGASGTAVPVMRTQQPVFNPGVFNLNGLSVTIASSASSIDMNKPVTVNATATYSNGSAADGATITLTCDPAGGTFGQNSFTTTKKVVIQNGAPTTIPMNSLITTFQAASPAKYNITATATKDGYVSGTASTFVTIIGPLATPTPTPTPTPTAAPIIATPTPVVPTPTVVAAASFDISPYLPYIIGAVLIILIIAIIVLYLWFKRTLRVIPKKPDMPADGKSVMPVKLMLVNGFGMSGKPGTDTEVELTVTSGTIKPAVLTTSKDYVETDFTASNEFGNVTITAKAGSKTANSTVKLTCDKAVLDIAGSPASIPADGKSTATIIVRVKDVNGNFVVPLEERTVELTTNLGKITTPVKMPAKSTATATLTSGDVTGTVVLTAVSGDLKGEGRMEFESKPKRFCMHCGSAMTMEASECPKCGLTPPSGVDTKPCATCGTVLPEAAKFCYRCGARQPELKPEVAAPVAKQPEPPK